ncbi:hypothetical protein C9374_000964 [Naegleria lovaniensis]|uniref:dihydropyrimidinase n=1 Tax=Naegleria lovaniensis TaxID=51637 RepID=A0AA88GYP2_NAELO|nr:uncharacterized protein C9374_000964 [Naegleria lovaniensis]KAG2388114.1 hypothetical protein C9374_000964 [Naegleria lovaniensis]
MFSRSPRNHSLLFVSLIMALTMLVVIAHATDPNINVDLTGHQDIHQQQQQPRSSDSPLIIIRGGIVVTHDNEFPANIVIKDGKITHIFSRTNPSWSIDYEHQVLNRDGIDISSQNVKIVDATGKYVMPGGIDPHVHLALPFMGTVSKDDFYHGTRAGLSGGTTMIIDFAIPSKGQSYIDIVKEYKKRGEKLSCADYGLHVAITGWDDNTAREMEELVKNHGINSFKFFMAYKGVLQVDDANLYQGFKKALEIGAISQVHAENGDLVVEGQRKLFEMGVTGPEGHPQSRPKNVEAEAVHRAAEIAYSVGNAPLYIVHVMSKDAMDEIARAKAKGYRIVGEPIAAGLTLDESVYYNGDWLQRAKYVMSPPIRSKADQLALISGLKNKILDLTGTDHCVFDSEQKKMGLHDFRKIPNGINGLEDRMSVLFDKLVASGELSPSDYVRVTSTEAAQIFNIYPQKGAIQVGSDADIIVLNPNATRVISAKTHHQNIDYNVYEGWKVRGVVDVTISNGRVVWENGKLNVQAGSGRFIPTPPFGKMFKGLKMEQAQKAPIKVD